jgi:RNA polymerase sigma-70 factor (ECF subfamily)
MTVQMEESKTEQQLVERARRGDREAFDELARRNRTSLLSFIRTRLGPRVREETEAEDVLQETHLKAIKSIGDFEWRGDRSFFKWLATIAEYVIRGFGRSKKQHPVVLDNDPVCSDPSPSRMARREERFDRLESALGSLTGDNRKVVELARIKGLPIVEVARRMDRSPGAIRHLLIRALHKLRDSFGEDTESLGLPGRVLGREGEDSDE